MQAEFKPELEATKFSVQNAFFFAKMSKIAYATREEVHAFMQGNEGATDRGLGFDHFYWFEVNVKKTGVTGTVRGFRAGLDAAQRMDRPPTADDCADFSNAFDCHDIAIVTLIYVG